MMESEKLIEADFWKIDILVQLMRFGALYILGHGELSFFFKKRKIIISWLLGKYAGQNKYCLLLYFNSLIGTKFV